jgi:GNAT superfamily N-acetyltransferase
LIFMSVTKIHDMEADDEYFVATCTHVNESAEIDASSRRRSAWFKKMYGRGLRIKVATLNGERVGFIYVMPIEVCPWGPLGRDLAAFPCLVAHGKVKGRGVGRALVAAAEAEAQKQQKKGIVTYGYYHDFWFMPAAYFEKLGFAVAARRGDVAILWKPFGSSAEAPSFLESAPRPEPVPGKVTVDLFFNTFCETSDIEAQRVREVAAEFGDAVTLRAYDAGDPATLQRYGRSRGIFVDGEEIFWGHEAPREGVRGAILKALTRERK